MGYDESLIKLKEKDMVYLTKNFTKVARILNFNDIEIFSVTKILKCIKARNKDRTNITPGFYLWVGGDRRGVRLSASELASKCDNFDVSNEYFVSNYEYDDIMRILEDDEYGIEYSDINDIKKLVN